MPFVDTSSKMFIVVEKKIAKHLRNRLTKILIRKNTPNFTPIVLQFRMINLEELSYVEKSFLKNFEIIARINLSKLITSFFKLLSHFVSFLRKRRNSNQIFILAIN